MRKHLPRRRPAPTKLMAFRLSAPVRRWLATIKARDGVSYTAQLERAMAMYAVSKGVTS